MNFFNELVFFNKALTFTGVIAFKKYPLNLGLQNFASISGSAVKNCTGFILSFPSFNQQNHHLEMENLAGQIFYLSSGQNHYFFGNYDTCAGLKFLPRGTYAANDFFQILVF